MHFRRWAGAAAACLAAALLATDVRAQTPTPLPAAQPESVGMSTERLARIATAFRRQVDLGHIPGAVFMVARRGKLVYAEAIGQQFSAPNRPMATDAIFRIYSMTKIQTSAVAMMLVEEGRLQLMDPISKYIPTLKNLQVSVATPGATPAETTYATVPAAREITIQDLLRHTAGLVYGDFTRNRQVADAYRRTKLLPPIYDGITNDFGLMTPQEMIDAFAQVPLAHQPGAVWEYSMSVDLLGRIIEIVEGKRLGDVMAERLYRPLRMANSGFWVPQANLPRVANGLPLDPDTRQPFALFDVSKPPKNDAGGAGAVGTAGDYLRFGQMLINGGQLDGTRVLSPATVRLMTADHLSPQVTAWLPPGEFTLRTPGYSFGLGVSVRRADGISGVHGTAGDYMWGGYAGTLFFADPKEQLVGVYMVQAPHAARAFNRSLFKQMVYQAIIE